MTKLLEAAKAVVENWYQNKAVVDSIEALHQASQDAEVYTPMNMDEIGNVIVHHAPLYRSDVDWFKSIERAVIERLGVRWPE